MLGSICKQRERKSSELEMEAGSISVAESLGMFDRGLEEADWVEEEAEEEAGEFIGRGFQKGGLRPLVQT